MKGRMSFFKITLIVGALIILFLSLASCSKKSGGSSDGGGGSAGPNENIAVVATPSSITVNGTSTITVAVNDSDGNPVPDGTAVTFSLSSADYGSLSNSTVTTANGVATTTFTAGSISGAVTITATSIFGFNNTTLTVGTVPGGAVATGSIQFISATPSIIGIKGVGREEISFITFLVSDLNGSPVDGASVSFTMAGPNGGEYIGEIDSTPNTATAVTVSGNVTVILHSGSIAGTVTIVATTLIDGVPISSSATPISIGGGVPSAAHFNIARTPVNLEGLSWSGLQSTVMAFLGDRFGNYNVMNGTSVSFYAESGAIDAQGITGGVTGTNVSGIDSTPGDTGEANVVFRTQDPIPQDVLRVLAGEALSRYFDGDNEPYRTYGSRTYNPRDGWCTIIAATKGEETFLDENLDGLFTRSYKNDKCPYGNSIICECDGGTAGGYAGYVQQGEKCTDTGKPGGNRSEGFVDIPGDPFYDVNDDGVRDDGQTFGHPFELYIDTNHNGSFDGPNVKWDGPDCQTSGCEQSKTIWETAPIVISGGPVFLPQPDANKCYNLTTDIASTCSATFNKDDFAVAPTTGITKGSSGSFKIIVGDYNLNKLQGGTKIIATASTIASAPTNTTATTNVITVIPSEYVVDDNFIPVGPTFFEFTVSVPVDTTADSTTVTVEVTTPNGSKNKTSTFVSIN
ncbi:MAG: hypothetical protein M0R70_01550 [Nitrospirae bacterium]|nr:hypothetical protein [Nitrospirota bacterium]